jgi:PhnB protein
MTYSETPPDSGYEVAEADRDKVMYAGIPFGSTTMMFMDMPTGSPLIMGNNISPTVNIADKDEVTRVFNELKEGGEVYMELQATFYSEWYGMVQDKYGVIWQILCWTPPA